MRAVNVIESVANYIRNNFEGLVFTRGTVDELGVTYGFGHVLDHARTYVRIEVDSYNFTLYIVAETIVQAPEVFQSFGRTEKTVRFDMGAGIDNAKRYLNTILPCYGVYAKEDEE